MTKKYSLSHKFAVLGLWLMFVLIGCNLGTAGGEPPPTLVPRATASPPPTLGFSGVAEQADGSSATVQVDNVSTPATSIDVELYALMQQVDADRLMAHVQVFQDFYTRHVNSTTTSNIQGIGAARTYIQEQ